VPVEGKPSIFCGDADETEEIDPMDTHPIAHPTDRTLHAYGLGRLDDASAESVNQHLEGCPDCRRRVAALSADSFLGRLRDAQARPESFRPAVSSTDGLSLLDRIAAPAPPAAGALPPGLADHPDYEVLRELGQGGMGVVFLAQNKLMGRMEVLKVVSEHLITKRGVLDRFLGEIRSAAKLHHPNIVAAYSALRLGEGLVLAMEYVEGLDLARIVKAKGPLPVANACYYIHQAALGLQHAHERGMVHRDIKPGNLMLSREGNRAVIKVLDFGLAKIRSEAPTDRSLTNDGQMLGTPDFIAPEQISDARRADIRADIYSLGCTFYYLLTGHPPFEGTSLYDVLQAHHSRDAQPLNLARPEVPVEVAAVAAKMMAKEPGRRFQEPQEVAQALRPFFKSGGAGASAPKSDVSRPGPSTGRWAARGMSSAPDRAGGGATPPPVATAEKSAGTPPRPDPMWRSLVAAEREGPSPETAATGAGNRRPPWTWPALAAWMLLTGFLVAWAAGVFRVKARDGVIVETSKASDPQGADAGDADLAARTEALQARLQERIAPKFPDETPFDDVLEYIKKETKKGPNDPGIPIYVDPIGLQEAERSMISTVTIDLEDTSLDNALTLILKQLGLVHRVKDGVLFISSSSGIERELQDTSSVKTARPSSKTRAILARLDAPLSMSYRNETPLKDVVDYIKQATHIQYHLDPTGLQEVERSVNSTVQIDLEGIPLKVTLRLMLRQLGLAFYVRDDVLVISSPDDVRKELGEPAKKEPETDGAEGGFGGTGGGMQ
jgi:serine/threonine protein kinase